MDENLPYLNSLGTVVDLHCLTVTVCYTYLPGAPVDLLLDIYV